MAVSSLKVKKTLPEKSNNKGTGRKALPHQERENKNEDDEGIGILGS